MTPFYRTPVYRMHLTSNNGVTEEIKLLHRTQNMYMT